MEKDIPCFACNDEMASFCCKTCNVHLCKGCEEINSKPSATTLHKITALFEEDDLMLKSLSPFCPHHPDLALDCFCEVNQEAICSKCASEPEHMTAHECRKMTLQDEEVRQREILAPELLYVQKVQTTLEDLKRSFRYQLQDDKDFISSCQAVLKEGDPDKEFLSTQSTYLEENVVLDIAKLDLLMVHVIKRFVDGFNSIKDLYGYGFITAAKNLYLTTLLEEIRSQEIGLPPIRKLNTSTWPKDLRLKLKDLGFQMAFKPTRDYSQINEQPIFQFGSLGKGDGQFYTPCCLAISPNGDVFVSDEGNHRVQAFDQKGNFLFQFGAEGTGSGQFNKPRGIAFDPNRNRVFISDQRNRIQYFDLNGNFLGSFGSKGSQDGQFSCPTGIAIDARNGDIYVADSINHRVQVFNENMKFLRKFGKKGNGNGKMEYPMGIGILSNGQLVVSEYGGNRLSVFQKNGKFVKHIGNGELNGPVHLFVDGKDNILVADMGNMRIAIFSIEGKLIKSIGNASKPLGITMNQEGKLFCDAGDKISVF